MSRTSFVRPAVILPALLAAVLLSACGSGNRNAPATNNTSTGNSGAATNQPANGSTVNKNSSAANASTANGASRAKLNLNTASRDEFLGAVPGLGNRMAHEFEEYRPYRSIQQFRREMAKYVDAAKIAEYERYVFVPVNENESDAATLQQIPGLDAKEAEELVAGRPYASREAFITKLSEKVSAEELAVGRNYLANR